MPSCIIFTNAIYLGGEWCPWVSTSRQTFRFSWIVSQATVIIALLQPTPEAFDVFDDVILMGEGKVGHACSSSCYAAIFLRLVQMFLKLVTFTHTSHSAADSKVIYALHLLRFPHPLWPDPFPWSKRRMHALFYVFGSGASTSKGCCWFPSGDRISRAEGELPFLSRSLCFCKGVFSDSGTCCSVNTVRPTQTSAWKSWPRPSTLNNNPWNLGIECQQKGNIENQAGVSVSLWAFDELKEML